MKISNSVLYCIKMQTSLFLLFPFFSSFSQSSEYKAASNCGCLLLVKNDVRSFSWSGSWENNYCNGYGTIRYYDAEDNFAGTYVGDVSDGLRTGYSSMYDSEGNLFLKGNFIQNKCPLALLLSSAEDFIGNFIIDSLFDGGINRSSKLKKVIFNNNDDLQEVRYQLSFDGDIVSSNHYYCTLVVKTDPLSVDFVDYNDYAAYYIAIKTVLWGMEIYNKIEKALDSK